MSAARGGGERAEGLSLVDAEGARRPAPAGARRLPEPLSAFVGRGDDVAAVAEALRSARLVTVAGPPGVGKTRLALEVARGRAHHGAPGAVVIEPAPVASPDATWLAELGPVDDPRQVAQAALAAVGAPPGPGPADDELVDHLRPRRALLVLDTCEHLREGVAALVQRLLGACPGLRVLATSRQPLGLPGERVRWLAPLPMPPRNRPGTGDAVALFVARAGDVAPAFALDPEVAPVVAAICRRLDGLPLAIELAAARLTVLTPAEILARLDDPFRLLTGGATGGEARHRSLRAAVDWSHDLLPAAAATLLRRLSVFTGGWSLDAAEEVCAGGDVARDEVLDLLDALVSRCLVVAEPAGGHTRYRLLGTIGAYARARLDAAGEAAALRIRHAAWCAARAEEGNEAGDTDDEERWLRRLDEDHDNCRAALAWALAGAAEDDPERAVVALRLANALTGFWRTRGHMREAVSWLRAALDATAGPSVARATGLRSAGQLLHLLGDHDAGADLTDRGLAMLAEVGDDELQGWVPQDVYAGARSPRHALPGLEDNVAASRAGGPPARLAKALCTLGQARLFRGDWAGARHAFGEVLDLSSATTDRDGHHDATFGLARVELLSGRYDLAEPLLDDVLRRAEQVGDAEGRCGALSVLAELHRARGDTERARALLVAALRLAVGTGTAVSIGRCELFLGNVEFSDGDLDAARVHYTRALGRLGGGILHHQVRCTLGLADVAAASGDTAVADAFYTEAHETAAAHGDDQGEARALAGRGDLAAAAGDLDRARRLRHQALEVQDRMGDRAAVVRSLEALASAAALEGRPDKAGRLFGAAGAARRRFGFARPAPHAAAYAAAVEEARGQADDDDAWTRSWEQGARLSLDQAVAYARKAHGRRRRPRSGLAALTPAERRVVALVAEGLTNPEIGERLFISRRTVGNHLASAYAKLGVHSRRELVAGFAAAFPGPADPG